MSKIESAQKTKLQLIEEALLESIVGGTYSDASCDHGDGTCYTCPDCTGGGA
ncbi:MAG: hypothetical protein V4732_08070 [Pseudomonadota bacterium]